MKESDTRTATLADSRVIKYAVFGRDAPDVPTIFFLHGFPGSHPEGELLASAALKHTARIVSVSRPGFGGSTCLPSRAILDWPADLTAVADALSGSPHSRFAVVAFSAGAPYALACLRAIPPARLAGAVLVSGLYPGTAGLPLGTRALFALGSVAPSLAAVGIEQTLGRVARDPPRLERSLVRDFRGRGAAEAAVVEHPEARGVLARSTQLAVVDGGAGTACEAGLLWRDWGFKLDELSVGQRRLLMWHGKEDTNVPVDMAEKTAAVLAGSELRVFPDLAHVSLLVARAEEIVVSAIEMLQ
ncbi:hypothetical protein PpBr36_04876 [Pyricularia pennisetigena]|uniref:hypothetical protein n=1 Tax=Pyricularia pennisetigena TaxID=1578925 RepID=UPI00114E8CD9|nr:hypothetical protein PpBr36_04876 [Pyricularia pennisetigena]TLS26137.1 hypothetical protein PpBr36_04876 [Pyricularia pennisetigena]